MDGTFKVATADDFTYTDPVDGSVSKEQGVRIISDDGSRVVFRKSGTGSTGATIRMYIERYQASYEGEQDKLFGNTQEELKGMVELGLMLSDIPSITGLSKPTVIT